MNLRVFLSCVIVEPMGEFVTNCNNQSSGGLNQPKVCYPEFIRLSNHLDLERKHTVIIYSLPITHKRYRTMSIDTHHTTPEDTPVYTLHTLIAPKVTKAMSFTKQYVAGDDKGGNQEPLYLGSFFIGGEPTYETCLLPDRRFKVWVSQMIRKYAY